MAFIKLDTLQYPVSEQDIRNEYPNTSFPVPFVPPEGYSPVLLSPTPDYDGMTQGYREGSPQQDSLGNWMQTFEVYDLDPEQAAANQAAKVKQVTDFIVQSTQQRLDDFAKTRNYDGILSLCTYNTSSVAKFAAEGQYGVTARDATWDKLYQIMSEVEAGTRPMPEGFADIEGELPVLQWTDEVPV